MTTVLPDRTDRVAPRLSPRAAPWLRRAGVQAALLLAAAFAIRCWQFGNPVVQIDDQFYLLVGDRMLHGGALPYVDIWDRKPIGLFLLYAGIRMLGGDGVVEYQVVATLFAAATALAIARIALRIAPPRGALVAGLCYLLYLGVFGGDGGQSPVFYNLFVAAAAWLLVRVVERPGFGAAALGLGCTAMALTGVAMQVKYCALFEGAFFGLALLWKARREFARWPACAAMGLGWVALAVAPTAAAWGWYVAIGQGDAFVFANFVSIFARNHAPVLMTLSRLAGMAALLSPLAVTAALGRWPHRPPPAAGFAADPAVHGFVTGWAIAAVVGVLLFGDYFDHYALPLLVPIAIAAAPLLGDRSAGLAIVARGRTRLVPAAAFVMLFAAGMSYAAIARARSIRGTGAEQRALAAVIAPRLTGCLLVFDGEPILYQMTHSCLPTRFAFPDHLTNRRETGALGVDQVAELRRIMAGRPGIVVSTFAPDAKIYRPAWDYMQREFVRDYRLVYALPVGRRVRIVYQRRAGH